MDNSPKEYQHPKNNSKYRFIIIILLSIIVLFIVFNLIKIPIPKERSITELKPYVVLDYYTAQEKVDEKGTCVRRNFSYSYSWLEWDEYNDGYMTPTLNLSNDENQAGTYMVQFAFFDEEKYSYILNRDKALWTDAIKYSDEKSINLEANVSTLVKIPTKKPNSQGSYWAIGDIKAPIIVDCSENTEYRTVIKNKTVTQYRNIEKSEIVTKKVTIWDYILGKY